MPVPSKTIGLIGGMSWESTLPYYRIINQRVRHACGGLHSAKLLLYSVDFHEIERLQHAGDWVGAGQAMAAAARSLHAGGADFLVLCTNTMHCVADAITSATPLPLLHIAAATADALIAAGVTRAGLLGTRFTMEQPFYRERLAARGLQVLVPPAQARARLHRVIYDELCQGIIRPESRGYFRRVMADLGQHGAQAIILGCTEISLLVDSSDAQLPLFDTTALHAEAAARASVHD
ncbi:aspartate/glutamate racemase [Xanthomonas arboricola pv. populi]|uniref:Aspartate/glutamate racemase n=1 Tax=Xanthomonas arboricola pv. populi TaxID=487823 RepID=A0A2S6Z040_9XANT|nr:aspartate/glutamate racemase family protein [Xanthomonas arboricola]PPT73738.1 aspartate/glutamate racemase [Xanthomonas arboricola pv. populi]